MNEAVRTLDYEGRFVVQSGDNLDAVYVVHRGSGGAELERVVLLNGPVREVIRSDEAVACLAPDQEHKINVARQSHGRSFSPLRGVGSEQLERAYEIQLLGADRVAGREAHQLLITPRDDLRFGYRLFIDKASALPLRSVMFDGDQRTVSQMMFVELRVNDSITPIEQDISALQLARADDPTPSLNDRLAPPGWTFASLPAGFELNLHRRRPTANVAVEAEHFIFSDGLASVSVYIQPAHGRGALQGQSRRGSANAIAREMDGHEVIVVGEVPYKTLNLFADQLHEAHR